MGFYSSTLGVILILHSAYSCLHYRTILLSAYNVVDLPSTYSPLSPPKDVVIECFIGFILCLTSQLASITLHPIKVASQGSSHELRAPLHRSRDFDLFFNTRAHDLYSVRQ